MVSLDDANTPALLDALDDLFFAFDDDGTLAFWNEAAETVTGYSGAELATMTVDDVIEEADGGGAAATVEELRETGDAVVEAALLTADGERIPYEFKIHRTPGGNAPAFVGIGRDITPRREAERERDALLNRMSDAFFAVDTDWRITYVNATGEEILGRAMGRDPDETAFEGLHLWEEIPDAVDTTFHEGYHRAMATGETVSFEEYFAPLDTWFDVRAFPSETGLSVYFYDVTERRSQREELEHREQLLKDLYRITADRDNTFIEQVEALLELGRAELDTEYGSLSEIRGDEYRFEVVDADDDSIQAGDVVPLEATNCELVASREERLVAGDVARDAPEETDRIGYTEWGISCYVGAPVFDDEGVYGTFCFYDTEPREGQFSPWEVTLVDLMSRWVSYELQRKQITERLQRQNERLEEFAGIVSHDLRNPLNVLQGRLELAEETGDPEQFAACYTAIERMETLIDDLLTLSKVSAVVAETESVALDAVAESAWNAVETADAALEIETDLTVTADASRLQQLFENLFRNAVEHGSTGSQPSHNNAVEHGSAGSRSEADGNAPEHGGDGVTVTVGSLDDGFYVADDGPGIPPDDRESVFESGYTTNPDGTGFGLAIVEKIAEAHGWRIDVTDSDAGGARFEIAGARA